MATEQADGIATGNGPGEAHVGIRGVIALGIYFIAGFIVCAIALVELWPHPTPAGTPKTDTGATATAPPGRDGSGAAPQSGRDSSGAASPAGRDGSGAASTAGRDSSGVAPAAGRDSSGTATTTTSTTTTAATGTQAPPKAPLPPGAACVDGSSNEKCVACEKAADALRQRSADPKAADPRANDPECVHVLWMWLVMWQEERLLLIVLLAGALGALLHCVRSFAGYVGFRKLILSWVPWYALTPFVGAFLAMVFYLTIRGGFFASNASVGSTSPFGFAAVAALVGMFSRQASEKLLKTFEALFTSAPPGTDAMGAPNPKPVLTGVTGTLTPGQPGDVTLNGTGFVKTSTAHIGSLELVTRGVVSEKQFIATVPAAQIPAKGQSITFTVVTPAPGGGTSGPQSLTV